MIRTLRYALALCLWIAAPCVHAAARAWVEPDRITLGEVAALNVEFDGSTSDAPDFAPLLQDFELRGTTSSSQTSIVNGSTTRRTVYAVALEPRRAGTLVIPPLRVGDDSTAPVTLTVVAAVPGSAERGDPVFLQAALGTLEPYVQQSVPYTVRLFYAVSLQDGSIDAAPPTGASLRQIGEDRNYQSDLDGRTYHVFERNYLLVPEKSGPLQMPPPRFRGRMRGNDMRSFFDNGRAISAVGESISVNVRPQPADAPVPWLVAESLKLTRGDVPGGGRAGEPLVLDLSLSADGATADQLPEIELPAIADAQVFPEPAQRSESLANGRPQATLRRRFAIIPMQAGSLHIPEVRVGYWNAGSDRADAATLPASTVAIAPGAVPATVAIAPAANAPAAIAPATEGTATAAVSPAPADARNWQMLAAALAVALVAAIGWGWRRGRAGAPRPVAGAAPESFAARVSPAALRRILATDDLRAISEALQGTATPSCRSLGAFAARLADPEQRLAVQALERALWADDVDAASHRDVRARLRSAFRDGPRFTVDRSSVADEPLPSLYPQR